MRRVKSLSALLLGVVMLVGCAPQTTQSLPGGAQPNSWITLAAIQPDDGVAPVVSELTAAQSSIDVVIYEIDPDFVPIVDALVAAKNRGVNVRILMSRKLFGSDKRDLNEQHAAQLRERGLDAQLSRPEFSYSHQKSIAIDAGTARARVLVFDFNLEPGYFGSATSQPNATDADGQTRGLAVIDTDPADIAEISATFEADWPPYAQWPPAHRSNVLWSPSDPAFAPPGNAVAILTSLINDARYSLDVYAMMVQLPSVLYEPLLRRAREGLRVRIVSNQGGVDPQAEREFAVAGIQLRYGPKSLNTHETMFIHSKAFVADGGHEGAVAFVGSQNPFLAESLSTERELGLLVSDPPSVTKIAGTFDRDFQSATPGQA